MKLERSTLVVKPQPIHPVRLGFLLLARFLRARQVLSEKKFSNYFKWEMICAEKITGVVSQHWDRDVHDDGLFGLVRRM